MLHSFTEENTAEVHSFGSMQGDPGSNFGGVGTVPLRYFGYRGAVKLREDNLSLWREQRLVADM